MKTRWFGLMIGLGLLVATLWGPAALVLVVVHAVPRDGSIAVAGLMIVGFALHNFMMASDLRSIDPVFIEYWPKEDKARLFALSERRKVMGILWFCGIGALIVLAYLFPIDGPMLLAGLLVLWYEYRILTAYLNKMQLLREAKANASTGPGSNLP